MEKLYEENPHLFSFSATVLDCTQGKHGWDILLDRTAFYPEGGGQPWDTGTLDQVRVTEVHAREDQVIHCCNAPLPLGKQVEGRIDAPRRLDLMQQHSGEHIVSGIACTMFGCDNVGFHLGADVVTIDLNVVLEQEQVDQLERRANEYLWQDHPVEIFYPSPAQLEALDYRSKKELSGQVRIVSFPGADTCACCGTHVSSAGQVGLIKLLSCQNFRSGVRITLVCGGRALEYLSNVLIQNRQISALLSAKPLETAQAVLRLQEDMSRLKLRCAQLEDRHFTRVAAEYAGAGDVLHFEQALTPDGLRRLTDAILETVTGRAACFSGDDTAGYQYAVGQRGGDLRPFTKEMNHSLGGRGGGTPDFVQGKIPASRREIEAFFRQSAAR